MELTSFEYIPAGTWCKPVASRDLMSKSGNIIYHHNIDENSSKLNLAGQLAAQPGFSDLHYCDSKFVSAFVPGFDVAAEYVKPRRSHS
jgi:hypothetical protein